MTDYQKNAHFDKIIEMLNESIAVGDNSFPSKGTDFDPRFGDVKAFVKCHVQAINLSYHEQRELVDYILGDIEKIKVVARGLKKMANICDL